MFFKYLEGLEASFLGPFLVAGNFVSHIDHCLVLLDKSGTAKVYVNELAIIAESIPKRAVAIGEALYKADIGGISRLRLGKRIGERKDDAEISITKVEFPGKGTVEFEDILIPDDAGIIFYFSVGWRRGFFFDLRPLHSDMRLENIEYQLARYYEYLMFNELYSIEEDVWQKMFSEGWFPFIAIVGHHQFESLLVRLKEGRSIEVLETGIIEDFGEDRLGNMLAKFSEKNWLKPHLPFIEAGIERYLADDYISSISNVWPRIEGMLRFTYSRSSNRPTQVDLIDDMRDDVISDLVAPSVFLPANFRDYLLRYYFKDFNIEAGELEASRHSIGHGVSESESYNRKRALLGILMVDQLSYYLQLRRGLVGGQD